MRTALLVLAGDSSYTFLQKRIPCALDCGFTPLPHFFFSLSIKHPI